MATSHIELLAQALERLRLGASPAQRDGFEEAFEEAFGPRSGADALADIPSIFAASCGAEGAVEPVEGARFGGLALYPVAACAGPATTTLWNLDTLAGSSVPRGPGAMLCQASDPSLPAFAFHVGPGFASIHIFG